jgi:hypothetical protein
MRTQKLLQQLQSFKEIMIYKSGRIRTTVSLAPPTLKSYQTAAGTPSNSPVGNYFLCARIISGNLIAEFEETVKLDCIPILAIE